MGDVVKLELQLDEDCNAACIMCSDFNSTTWRKYNENTVKRPIKIHHTTTVEQRISAVEATIDFETVRQIHFFGGEPFNTDTHLRIIKQVKHPESTNLVYVSNCSVFPDDETIELWKRFKHVNLACSIDGIGEHFNYLRWPLQWDQVENNLIKYRSMISSKFAMNSSFTGSPLNLYYTDRYISWADEFFADIKFNEYRYKNWFKNPHPVVGTMNLNSVPPLLEQAILDKYGSDSRIYRIINEYDPVKYKKFIDYIEYHDQYRKLNFRQVFPEIAEYFTNDHE
jgi:pyruvate-formate lyase-activating enzyme